MFYSTRELWTGNQYHLVITSHSLLSDVRRFHTVTDCRMRKSRTNYESFGMCDDILVLLSQLINKPNTYYILLVQL